MKDILLEIMNEKLEEVSKEKASINIETVNGNTHMEVEGGTMTLVILLAGVEKRLLKELDVDPKLFELVKKVVATEEVEHGQ